MNKLWFDNLKCIPFLPFYSIKTFYSILSTIQQKESNVHFAVLLDPVAIKRFCRTLHIISNKTLLYLENEQTITIISSYTHCTDP